MERGKRKLRIIYSKTHNGEGAWAENKRDECHSEKYFAWLTDSTESWKKKSIDYYAILTGREILVHFLSVVDVGCCCSEYKEIEGAPPSWFTFASRLCGVEWTRPSGNSLTFCDLNNQQWLGGTGNSSSNSQLFCGFYRVRSFSSFLCIYLIFFFNLRLRGVQTAKKNPTNKNFVYHFRQEKKNTKPDPNHWVWRHCHL